MKKGLIHMALVNTKEMFEKAYNGGYAIGAFNVNNMDTRIPPGRKVPAYFKGICVLPVVGSELPDPPKNSARVSL